MRKIRRIAKFSVSRPANEAVWSRPMDAIYRMEHRAAKKPIIFVCKDNAKGSLVSPKDFD